MDVNDDWHERIPSFRLVLDQDKARALGVSTSGLSQALQAHYAGIPVGQLREQDKLIDIVWRASPELRTAADELPDVAVRTANGKSVSLSQFVKFETVFEDGVRWRRNRFPTISVRADVADGKMAPDVAAQIIPKLKPIQDSLPAGYFIETGAVQGRCLDRAKVDSDLDSAGADRHADLVDDAIAESVQDFHGVQHRAAGRDRRGLRLAVVPERRSVSWRCSASWRWPA